MNVTFDSNVWEKLVVTKCEEGSKYAALKKLIQQEKIRPYICEIAISLESIMKKERVNFWNNYEPKIDFEHIDSTENTDGSATIRNRVMFAPNNDRHPGLHPTLINNLKLAEQLGFKVLRMTNLGTARADQIPKAMLIDFDNLDDFWEYAEKVSNCGDRIIELKCGGYDYFKFKSVNCVEGLPFVEIIQKIDNSKHKLFAKAVAEWADGDSIAAHYAYGNKIFCTEDRAKSAGTRSIFSSNNISIIKEEYNIDVLSIDEVLDVINGLLVKC